MSSKTDDDYTNLLQTCGIGHLVQMLQKYLDRMKLQDKAVEIYLSNTSLDDNMLDTLRTAKSKSTEVEIKLLRSIMDNISEMVDFLNSIILIENTFNILYQSLRKEQQLSRYKVEETIIKYENPEQKPRSNDSSFVALIKGSQTNYLSSFKSFITQFELKLNKNYRSSSGAKSKGIERAFYKTFYVYNGDFKQMLDILRCSFVFDNFEDLYCAFTVFEEFCNSKSNPILRVKDRFNPQTISYGYRDLMMNIKCPNSDICAEVQFHHYEFYKFKKPSHKMYKKARLFDHDEKNDAYKYAQIHIRPNMKHDTILKSNIDDNNDNDDQIGIDLDGLDADDNNNIDKLSDHIINQFKALNYGPSHIKRCINNLSGYLSNVRKTAKYKVTTALCRLCGTELDDIQIYKHAQENVIDKFPYGKRMTLTLQPITLDDFNGNFRTFCKYGLNSLIIDYFDESCKDYAQILNDLFDKNENESDESIWDRHIINIMIEYLKAPFSIFDLFRTKNRFNETGMTLAAKYGQSATVEVIIKYAVKFGMIEELINHRANGGSPLFWLFRCYSPDVFKFLDNTNSIRPTMMLLLKNGAFVAPTFQYRSKFGKEGGNVMQLARLRGKKIEGDILESYLKVEKKETKSPLEYAKKQNNNDLINILKLYHVQ